MEHVTETITLDIEEQSELDFRVKIEGTNAAPRVRLVCESGDVAYMFSGRQVVDDADVVRFSLPQMKDKITEGVFPARVEVFVENRYFTPVQFQVAFKKSVKVVAESISLVSKPQKQDVTVSAGPIVVRQVSRPVVEEVAKPVPAPQKQTYTPDANKIQSQQVNRAPSLKERYQQKAVRKH